MLNSNRFPGAGFVQAQLLGDQEENTLPQSVVPEEACPPSAVVVLSSAPQAFKSHVEIK